MPGARKEEGRSAAGRTSFTPGIVYLEGMPLLDSPETFEVHFHDQGDRLRRRASCFLRDETAAEAAVQETFSRGLASLHTSPRKPVRTSGCIRST